MQLRFQISGGTEPGLKSLFELMKSGVLTLEATLVSPTKRTVLPAVQDTAKMQLVFRISDTNANGLDFQWTISHKQTPGQVTLHKQLQKFNLQNLTAVPATPPGEAPTEPPLFKLLPHSWIDQNLSTTVVRTDPVLHPLLRLDDTAVGKPALSLKLFHPFALSTYKAKVQKPDAKDPNGKEAFKLNEKITKISKEHSKKISPTFQFANLAFSVIDLTNKKRNFAGFRADEQHSTASMGKIIIMYTAFELRAALRRSKDWTTVPITSQFLPLMTKIWSAEIKDTVEQRGEDSDLKLPNLLHLDKIFTSTSGVGGPSIDFTTTPLKAFLASHWSTFLKVKENRKKTAISKGEKPPPDVPKEPPETEIEQLGWIHKDGDLRGLVLNQLGFLERLKLMVGFSDNDATNSVIENLGFRYLNACLISSGFYVLKGPQKGGLWIGSMFTGIRIWSGPPVGSPQTCTARTMAEFMLLMQDEILVDSPSSIEMQGLLSKVPRASSNNGESWIKDNGFTPTSQAIMRMYSKAGGGNFPTDFSTEAAYLKRPHKSGSIEYVVVVLEAVHKQGEEIVAQVTLPLDSAIKDAN